MSYLLMGLLSVLVSVFAVSGGSKIRSRAALSAFTDSLRPLLPARLVNSVALVVATAEVMVVLGIGWSMVATAGGWSAARSGATLMIVLAGLLLSALTAGLILAVHRRTEVMCACFGATRRPLSWRHVTRNLILLAGTAAALVAVASSASRPLPLAGTLVAVLAGAMSALFLIRLEDVIDLFQPGRPSHVRP